MLHNRQRYGVLVLLAVSFVVLLVVSKLYGYELTDFAIRHDGGEYRSVTMPISESPQSAHVYEVRGQLKMGHFTSSKILIIPDDRLLELTVNDDAVDLSRYPSSALRDYVKGISIDLTDHLKVGENQIYVRYQDFGGRMGLRILPDPKNGFLITLAIAWTVFLLAAAYFFIRAFGIGRALSGILVFSLFIKILYFMVTDYNIRDHDAYDHLAYINYFVEHKALPPVEMSARRVFFHPPFYYITTAIYSSAFEYFASGQSWSANRAIQGLSIFYSLLFSIFSVKTILTIFSHVEHSKIAEKRAGSCDLKIHRRSPCGKYAWMSCLLLVFWPSAILHSTRIGNDSLLYAATAAALYFLVKFYFEKQKRDAIYFSIFVSFGILTKVSAAIFLPVALLVLAKMCLSRELDVRRDLARLISIPTLLFVTSLSFALYPGVVSKLQNQKDHIYIENIEGVHSGLRVPNEPRNYFWFDIKTFMTEAYTSPWDDQKGRVFFWNYLSKTSLFGEWSFPGVLLTFMASVISLCFLTILAYTAAAVLNIRWVDFFFLFPLIVFTVAMYAAVTYMRATFPVNIDFRYIAPTLICSAIVFNYFLWQLESHGRNRLALLGLVNQSVFIVFSIIFVIVIFFQGIMG